MLTYSIQAKPGWQIASVELTGSSSGTFIESQGGKIVVDGWNTMGNWGDAGVGANVLTSSGGNVTGAWNQNYYHYFSGNPVINVTEDRYQQVGDSYLYAGSTWSSSVSRENAAITNVIGFSNLNIYASTLSESQFASFNAAPGNINFQVQVARNISPVPEPQSYALLVSSLLLIAFLTRRNKKSEH
jgi:hypothetical protein